MGFISTIKSRFVPILLKIGEGESDRNDVLYYCKPGRVCSWLILWLTCRSHVAWGTDMQKRTALQYSNMQSIQRVIFSFYSASA